MDYLDWNNALARQFFREENAGRRVFLYVTGEVVTKLGTTASAISDFVEAVQVGPPWVTRGGLCQRALQAMDGWRLRDCEYPPYIGYLAAFVLAATLDGPFPSHAYYPRLNTLLGKPPDTGTPASFNRMYELWSDLEQWSSAEKDGQLGIFTADIVGGWLHVGIPLAQTVLTEKERSGFPNFFARRDFDPGAVATDFELKQALLADPPETLRPRTLALLESVDAGSADLRAALVSVVSDELRQWDGYVSETSSNARIHQIPLRLCLLYDSVIGAAAFSLRCRVTDESLDEVELVQDGSARVFECNSLAMGWTSALVDRKTGAVLDASELDWRAASAFRVLNQPIRLRLPSLNVRIFVSGAQVGLPGFVETRQLTRNTALYVASHESVTGAVVKWGASECVGFREIVVRRGLPSGWRLFSTEAALADSVIKTVSPNVSFPTSLRLWLKGGVRARPASNHYFSFAPPRVEVIGSGESPVPFCEGRPCKAALGDGFYRLPDVLPSGTPIRVTIESSTGTRQQRFLTLVDDFAASSEGKFAWFDRLGVPILATKPTNASYSGAIVRDGPASEECLVLPSLSGGGAAVLLGRRPGQIVHWPAEEFPSAWSPIWVVHSRRKTGHVSYCGGQIEDSEPCAEPVGTSRQVAAWKEIIWRRRRRVSAPHIATLRALWSRYQQVASDA